MWPIVGNENIVSYIEAALKSGRLSHAYLFTGRAHIGKTKIALALASAVNCISQEKPCGECSSCNRIAAGKHPDVETIRLLSAEESEDKKAKSEVVIEQIRKLQHSASLPPYEGRCRVFIFEHAELINDEAANCLLKTLEEPLPNVMFILLAHNRKDLPDTVVSRCQAIELRPVPKQIIERMLLSHGVDRQEADLLARMAAGAPGWAINAAENKDIVQQRLDMLHLFLSLITANYNERFEAAERLVRDIPDRNEMIWLIGEWRRLWRDIILAKLGQSDAIINLSLSEEIFEVAPRLNSNKILNFIRTLNSAEKHLRHNVNARIEFESLLLEMPRLDKALAKG
jgi:DNA polymerase-3 subunit delta'